MAREGVLKLALNEVDVPDGRRPCDENAVKHLAKSMDSLGLQHPITVLSRGNGKFRLVAGLHRLRAAEHLGWEYIDAHIAKMSNADARMWEIAENLHRLELTKLERAEQIEEWRELARERKGAQIAHPGGSQPSNRGVSAAAEELGVDRAEVQRAGRIAGLSDDAKEAAREVGLDDHQTALLTAARAPHDEQPRIIRELAERASQRSAIKPSPDPLDDAEAAEKQVAALMSAWNRACAEAREEFLLRIDRPVFDKTRMGDAA